MTKRKNETSRPMNGDKVLHDLETTDFSGKKLELTPIDSALKGEFMWLKKITLQVPWEDYQRDRTASSRAKEIAVAWNWAALGTLIVIIRPDKSHCVADGGTRLAAAYMRPDIDELPCMVHEVHAGKQEAEIFRLINMNRDKLKTIELQHAELFEGRTIAIETKKYLEELGRSHINFDSLAELRRKLGRQYRPHTLRLLPLLKDVASGHALSARAFKGLITLESRMFKDGDSLTKKPYTNRLKKYGIRGIETAIAAMIPPSTGNSSSKLCAQAIANLLRVPD